MDSNFVFVSLCMADCARNHGGEKIVAKDNCDLQYIPKLVVLPVG